MNDIYKIKILLATYNGDKFIATQLESIIKQSHTNWELLISDDGSTDDTLSIINKYCLQDSRIRIVNEELSKLGSSQNFGNLIKTVLNESFDFLMFADQDDFWYSNKIELSLAAMVSEKDFITIPKLIYTNFEFADENLNPLLEETMRITSTWKEPSFERLLVQNNIYGCTMMLNKKLSEKVFPVPVCAENHDYWVALIASCLGKIVHVKHSLMLYRQHSNNVSGHYTNNTFSKRFYRFFRSWKKLEFTLVSSQNQSLELYKRYSNEIFFDKNKILQKYCTLIIEKSPKLLLFQYSNGICRNTRIQTIMLYLILLKILFFPSNRLLQIKL